MSVCLLNKRCRFESGRCFHKPKCVRLQERKSTYCSARWTLMKAASRHKRKYQVSATLRDGSLWIPQGRMCPKEIYNVLMQEFAGFHKTSVDVRYWLILSVSTGSNAGRCGWNRSSSQSVLLQLLCYQHSSDFCADIIPEEEKDAKGKTKTDSSKTIFSPSVAKRYGNGPLTRIPQVRILSDGYARFV